LTDNIPNDPEDEGNIDKNKPTRKMLFKKSIVSRKWNKEKARNLVSSGPIPDKKKMRVFLMILCGVFIRK